MFIPMMRVEKVILDESAAGLKSLSEQFHERVGSSVLDFVDIPDDDEFEF